MEKVVAAGRDSDTTRVWDIMSSPALSVSVNTSVATAAALMRKHHIRHLVVLDEHETLVGMLALCLYFTTSWTTWSAMSAIL